MIKFFIFGTEKYRFAVDIPNKRTDLFLKKIWANAPLLVHIHLTTSGTNVT